MMRRETAREPSHEAGAEAPAPAASTPLPLDDARLARLVGYNIARANIRTLKAFHQHLGALALKPAEFSALVLLSANPGISQKQLGDALDISPPNLAVLIDQLVKRGLLKRVRSALDRRVQQPHLTRQGETLLQKAEARATVMEEKNLQILTAGERAILLELLRKLSA